MKAPKEYHPLEDGNVVLPVLGQIPIFGALSREQLEAVFKLLKKVKYARGETIFKRGDKPTFIYVIKSGKVKLVEEAAEGSLELIELGIGRVFGETALIGIQPHDLDAVVTEDAELIVLSSAGLLSIFDTDKELFAMLILNIAREACRKLYQTDEVLLHYVDKEPR